MFGRELHGLEAKRRSPLYRIDRAAPPAFLAAAADDGAVTPLGACRYAECLLAAGAGAALHLYPSGGHGFGLRREFAWREAACRGVEDVARCDDRDGVISPFPKKILSLRPKPYRYGRE